MTIPLLQCEWVKEGCGVQQQPPSILAWQQLVSVDTNKSAFKAFYFHSLCQFGGHVSHNSSECSKIPSWTASWHTMKLPPVSLLVCLFQTKLNSVITAQCNCITRINTYLHAWPPVCSVELKMFWKGPSILTPISNALMQVYFMWTSYHMATLTMQHNIRTREMKDETLSCPLKHKPFGFNKSLEPLILSAFCCFRENVMCWFHFVSPWYHSCSPSFHPFSAGN